MRLLADENIPLASILALRDLGHDVMSLSENSPGASDERGLALAREQGRILITFDRDYGDLLYRRELASPPGVVYLRFTPRSAIEPAEILSLLFAQIADGIEGHFFVVERDTFRRRPLPRTSGDETAQS